MDIFNLRMHRAALLRLLKDMSEEMSEEKRLEIWQTIEKLDDVIEEIERKLKKE